MAHRSPIGPDLHASKAHEIWPVVITFPILAAIVIVLRLYTRISILRNHALDDWLAAAALVFAVGMSICMGFEVKYGLGRHVETLTFEDYVNIQKALYASIFFYNFSLILTKLSILVQYLRISSATSTKITIATYSVIGFVILYGIETFFTSVFACWPVAFYWDPNIPGGKCINKPVLGFTNAGITILTDAMILILPIFILQGLLLPRRQKIGVSLVLSLGGFSCIASIIRLYALYKVSSSTDQSWDVPVIVIWSCIELNTGVICVGLGSLKPLISRYLPGLLGSSHAFEVSNVYGRRSQGMRPLDEEGLRNGPDVEFSDNFLTLNK